jgi:hypothetical protein
VAVLVPHRALVGVGGRDRATFTTVVSPFDVAAEHVYVQRSPGSSEPAVSSPFSETATP